MAAGTWQFYDDALERLCNGELDLAGGPFAAILVDSGYSPDTASDANYSDISGDENGDGDYVQQAVAVPAVSIPGAGTIRWDSGNISFGTSVTITSKFCVIVEGTAGSLGGSDPLICFVDLNIGGDAVAAAEPFDVEIAATGIAQLSQS